MILVIEVLLGMLDLRVTSDIPVVKEILGILDQVVMLDHRAI